MLLTGGEPFLYPDFERLYVTLHKMGLTIDINSNGTLIKDEHIQWLDKNRPRHIKISLYGSSEKSYENLCGDGSAFIKVINVFEKLKKKGITVYSSITVTPHNYNELDDMLALCDDYKIPVKATSYMFPPLRSAQTHVHEKYRLSSYEAAYATMKIAKYANDEKLFWEKAKEYSDETHQNFMNCLQSNAECGHMGCRGGSCTFWVTWEGKMIPCAMMGIGNYPVMGGINFDEAWELTKKLTRTIRISSECTHCAVKESCYSCAASALCETRYTGERPLYPCEMTGHYMKIMKSEYDRHKIVEGK